MDFKLLASFIWRVSVCSEFSKISILWYIHQWSEPLSFTEVAQVDVFFTCIGWHTPALHFCWHAVFAAVLKISCWWRCGLHNANVAVIDVIILWFWLKWRLWFLCLWHCVCQNVDVALPALVDAGVNNVICCVANLLIWHFVHAVVIHSQNWNASGIASDAEDHNLICDAVCLMNLGLFCVCRLLLFCCWVSVAHWAVKWPGLFLFLKLLSFLVDFHHVWEVKFGFHSVGEPLQKITISVDLKIENGF